MPDWLRGGILAGVLAALVAGPGGTAYALDKVRLGKAVPNSFAFSTAEIGTEAKIFEKEGLEIEVTAFRGDAQLQQGLTAGSLEVGLGSGPGLGFRAKGALSVGVAAMYGAPANLALVVPSDSPVKAAGDLKGKRIGVTTPGSLTDWLVRELSRQQGWGSDGMRILALGQMQARLAAMQRGELDGMVIEAATGYELEEAGKARILMLFGDIAKDFYTHVIFSTDDVVNNRPELLRAVPARLVSDRGLYEGEQGFRREGRGEDDRRQAQHRRQDLRRADRRLLARRRLEPGVDRRDPPLAQGARHPSRRAGGEGDLQRPVRAGEVLSS